jgi:integrase-like protein
MAARCRRNSAPPGPSADARRRATSPSASLRTGCGRRSTRRVGALPGMVRTGAVFADADAEFLRFCELDRGCKPSTLRDYRSNLEAHLLPAFGSVRLEEIAAPEIDRWRGSLTGLSLPSSGGGKLTIAFAATRSRADRSASSAPGCKALVGVVNAESESDRRSTQVLTAVRSRRPARSDPRDSNHAVSGGRAADRAVGLLRQRRGAANRPVRGRESLRPARREIGRSAPRRPRPTDAGLAGGRVRLVRALLLHA